MTLLRGDCLALLPTLGDASVDSIVTDPPYELGFMGKSWDSTGIAYNVDLWRECLRVLKPGGHLLAFGGSRTYHRLACAVEDAGFEIRDQIMWIYGSGFPKSLDVSKAINKAVGAERGDRTVVTAEKSVSHENPTRKVTNAGTPAIPEAQQWEGWGTALKPAHEPIVVARKPFVGTVANNVLTYGTGALNIDGCRVGTADGFGGGAKGTSGFAAGYEGDGFVVSTQGRWPANVIHDGSDEVLAGFPEAKGGTWNTTAGARHFNNDGEPTLFETSKVDGSKGSAGRFFFNTKSDAEPVTFSITPENSEHGATDSNGKSFIYCAKAGRNEREQGLAWGEKLSGGDATDRVDVPLGLNSPRAGAGRNGGRANIHPTVKPLELMRYLVRLVTPPNGVVLDPFLGSGTTACAAIFEGFEWVGCEMTEDYWPIIEARVRWANEQGHHERLFT